MYIPLRIQSAPDELGPVELRAYMKRIGALDAFLSSLDHLGHLQQRHLLSIPYENFDAAAGLPASVDERAIWQKLVASHRGGSGFELNRLFMPLLRHLGFEVAPVVGLGPDGRRRLLLRVPVDGVDHLVDVGHVIPSVAPLPLVDGGELNGRIARLRTRGTSTGEWSVEVFEEGAGGASDPEPGAGSRSPEGRSAEARWRRICLVAPEPADDDALGALWIDVAEAERREATEAGPRAAIAIEEGTATLEGDLLTVRRGNDVKRTRLDEARRARMLEHLFELDPAALPRA